MRRGRGDLIQFVFRCSGRGAEAALASLGTLGGLSGLSLSKRLQLERPLGGLRAGTHLDLLASVLEAEHLDFHAVGSRRKTGQFERARLIGGGHRVVVAFGGGYGGSRQRLTAELHCAGVGETGLGVRQPTDSQN